MGRDYFNLVRLKEILERLEERRSRLKEANAANGNLARYGDMKREIEALGWDGICKRYHPDINIDDPAAFELFELYQFVYATMRRETQ